MMSLKMQAASGILKTIMIGEADAGRQNTLCRIIRGDQDLQKVAGQRTTQFHLNKNITITLFTNSSNDSELNLLYLGAQIILVVFDVSRRKTLNKALAQFQATKKNYCGKHAQLLLIAHRIGNGPREVTPEEGEKTALKCDMMYMEVDAEKTTQKELWNKLIELGEKYLFVLAQNE